MILIIHFAEKKKKFVLSLWWVYAYHSKLENCFDSINKEIKQHKTVK
jgi:hypothetical protein